MRVLGVDTTTAFGSVALTEGETLCALCGVGPAPHHAENLLPTIDWLLQRLGWSLDELSGLAVASGPGSFTGLKIGIASMEGLSLARGLPIVGVSSLLATAWPLRHVSDPIASVLQAYRGEVYASLFRSEPVSGELEATHPAVCKPPGDLIDRMPEGTLWLTGSGIAPHRTQFEESLGARARFPEASYFLAEAVARLGARALERGESGVDVLYVRASEAERNRDQRQGP